MKIHKYICFVIHRKIKHNIKTASIRVFIDFFIHFMLLLLLLFPRECEIVSKNIFLASFFISQNKTENKS